MIENSKTDKIKGKHNMVKKEENEERIQFIHLKIPKLEYFNIISEKEINFSINKLLL